MMMKKFALISALAFSAFPLFAYADDISIMNNTNSPGTGYLSGKYSDSPCSSDAGTGGVIEPHSSIVLPEYVINLIYCSISPCKGTIFMSTNCSGRKIATVTIDRRKGVTDITNHNVDGYIVSGGGSSISINGGPTKKWYNFLF